MKVCYSNLRCPHCGATNFTLVKGDVFLCEYCNEKFNFDLEKIEINAENKVFIEELKQQFYNQLSPINEKIKENKIKFKICNKLAHPKIFKTVAYLCLVVFIISIMVLTQLSDNFLGYAIIGSVLSVGLIILAYIHAKIRYRKYRPLMSYFANKIIEYEEKASFYTKLISKLTK